MERSVSPMVRQLTGYKWKDALEDMITHKVSSVIVQTGPDDYEYSLLKKDGKIWQLTKTKYQLHMTLASVGSS